MNKPFWAINLKKARKQLKLTQQEVADRIFKSQQAYDKYERGESEPDIETWKLLWDLFKVVDPMKFWNEDYFNEQDLKVA
jgi:transcriptional regulator with XRE-family HTH domain